MMRADTKVTIQMDPDKDLLYSASILRNYRHKLSLINTNVGSANSLESCTLRIFFLSPFLRSTIMLNYVYYSAKTVKLYLE